MDTEQLQVSITNRWRVEESSDGGKRENEKTGINQSESIVFRFVVESKMKRKIGSKNK
jgi:hypothetical protein